MLPFDLDLISDCYEVYQRGSARNGVYKIFLPGLKYYVDVYCDMKNGGWTLIQKRSSGDVDFFKDWKAYKEGFGVNTGEHYLGNDFIHFLTNQGHYSLHVELVNWKKEKRQAMYKDFWIDEEDDGYKLHIEGYDGDAGDGLSKHNEMKFSTHDVDNDQVIKQFGGSCAKRFHGAGWYYKCYSSNLNGQYYEDGVVPPKKFDGVAWKPWTGPNYSLKEVVLKVRPKDVL
ncbi:hypothetical protein LOTGIDRAFT_185616 [Lottia gigantea]|uniref:Fibrinogen C-terminal domain-containing protein n=1 Tax=Lottia gigantea TaxID=225164 RepID=V4AFU1_LOTGI|nr:hypothetical protein LOTGIDRAFT_185616 [Lottia gigantea]ESP02874.1 hypothetical protein LOTGIDRAFT_185616 [Lottia gigantea]